MRRVIFFFFFFFSPNEQRGGGGGAASLFFFSLFSRPRAGLATVSSLFRVGNQCAEYRGGQRNEVRSRLNLDLALPRVLGKPSVKPPNNP